MQQSASGGLEISGGGADKGSIVFTIVELLLIALLLLCNCLNLVSVLGFGAPQAKAAAATSGEETEIPSQVVLDDFETWQRELVGHSDEDDENRGWDELMAAEGQHVHEIPSLSESSQ